MKKTNQNACPGCGRHCTIDHVRCKYGRQFFAKQTAALQGADHKPHRRKWEKYTEAGGAAWQLLTVSRQVKKALVRGGITEQQLLAPLSPDEQQMLTSLLGRLSRPEADSARP